MSEQLIAACCSSNPEELRGLLVQDSMVQTTLSYEDVCIDEFVDTWRPFLNLQRMLVAASKAGSAETVEILLKLGQEHRVPIEDILNRETAQAPMRSEDPVGVYRKFVAVDRDILSRPLHMGGYILLGACSGGQDALVKYLLESGVDPNVVVTPQTDKPGYCLYMATWMASVNIIGYLLDHGAIITGSGAIHKAAEKGRIDVLEMLLQHGADLNENWHGQLTAGQGSRGGTPLHMAVSHDQVQTVKWLLDHGADSNIRNEDGKTAVDLGYISGNAMIMAFLKENAK